VIRAALDALLDAVFPPRCAGCGATGSFFCQACVATIEPVPAPWCAGCGRTVALPGLCGECRAEPPALCGVRSAGLLAGPLRKAVHRLKYRGGSNLGPALAALLVGPARHLLPDVRGSRSRLAAGELVVPVPLHAQRRRERGYNQSQALAAPLARVLGLECAPEAALRVRPTLPQVGLSRAERRLNVRGAFAASGLVRGRTVLLVDDVATTGSTLGAAAAACRDAGAACVVAVTLAREGERAGAAFDRPGARGAPVLRHSRGGEVHLAHQLR
jgi:ComF family protein